MGDLIMKTEDFVKQIMKSNDVHYDYNVVTENSVEINVELGDWKHDHLCIDRLMEKNGFNKVDEEVTFDDGSDVYSSTHRYQREGNEYTCCICGRISKGFGNNPWPIKNKGVCCDKRNLLVVNERIELLWK